MSAGVDILVTRCGRVEEVDERDAGFDILAVGCFTRIAPEVPPIS
jgi:hypothetical protein